MTDAAATYLASNAWPFQEAEKLVKRFEKSPPPKGYVLFETGYGPSGLPHLGTFGEVARTTMVRRAFQKLSAIPTRLFAFSDDMDGFRKVPDNVPNQEMLREHLGKPLCRVPDPFGTHSSFGAHNNARLQAFLDQFGFEYEFQSAADWYASGRFDEALLGVLRNYDAVMAIMLPSLRAERASTYSPFLPICAKTGRVLQAAVIATDPGKGTITYRDDDGDEIEVPVTGGHCKLQWKCDWAMRWVALGVDYEMSGKDLIDSVKLSGQISRALGRQPPEGFTYELFLDEKGEKISKSKGNGLTIEDWLTYASPETLSLYMFQKPKAAKRLHFDVIPRTVDDYLAFLEKFPGQSGAERYANPVFHIHGDNAPGEKMPVSFGMLLNLAGVCNAEGPEVLWAFLQRYAPGSNPADNPILNQLVGYALAYYRDFVKPAKRYRAPTPVERAAIEELAGHLATPGLAADADALQTEVFEIGKRHGFTNLRDWFKALYEVLLGQETGPRMGSFIALYGIAETRGLIDKALKGDSLAA